MLISIVGLDFVGFSLVLASTFAFEAGARLVVDFVGSFTVAADLGFARSLVLEVVAFALTSDLGFAGALLVGLTPLMAGSFVLSALLRFAGGAFSGEAGRF